jgi:hypothetical protein
VFDGSLPINPQIDLKALYVVRRVGANGSSQSDIGVYAQVKGPLDPGPQLTFSSDQNYDISQSDLVSYLVAGQPGFLGDHPDVAQTVLSVLAPTLNSLTQQGLSNAITGLPYVGSIAQQYQFQFLFTGGLSGVQQTPGTTGGLTSNTFSNSLNSFIYGSSVGGQVQLTDRLSLGVSAGLCYFNPNRTSNVQLSPSEIFSGRLQYRLGASSNSYALQAGREPGTQARYCQTDVAGVITAPSQWSLSLSKFWRF